MKKVSLLIVFLFLMVSAINLTFTAPQLWESIRSDSLLVAFNVDSADLGNKISLSLNKHTNGKDYVVKSQVLTLKKTSESVTFKLPKQIVGGDDYYFIKWEDKSGSKTKQVLAPLGKAPLYDLVPTNSLKIENINVTNLDKLPFNKVGDNSFALSWNPTELTVVVKGSGVTSLTLDPGNLKGSFLAFSQRTIKVDFDKNETNFYYTEKTLKGDRIKYSLKDWNGDITSKIGNGVATVTIPWYELGIKPFTGRVLGIYVKNGDAKYPANAIGKIPATWGNFILK